MWIKLQESYIQYNQIVLSSIILRFIVKDRKLLLYRSKLLFDCAQLNFYPWVVLHQACFRVYLTTLQLDHLPENTPFPTSSYSCHLQSSTWPLSAPNCLVKLQCFYETSLQSHNFFLSMFTHRATLMCCIICMFSLVLFPHVFSKSLPSSLLIWSQESSE